MSIAEPLQAGDHITRSFRHISWIRFELSASGTRAEVHGVRHRLPVTVPASLEAALALAASGIPTVVVGPDQDQG
jgi:hypothetical protein